VKQQAWSLIMKRLTGVTVVVAGIGAVAASSA